jgi:hypothetical protein
MGENQTYFDMVAQISNIIYDSGGIILFVIILLMIF